MSALWRSFTSIKKRTANTMLKIKARKCTIHNVKLKCLYVYLAQGMDYSSVNLITKCQEKVDVTNQCNFNLNATNLTM
jgi:hypothetical protein